MNVTCSSRQTIFRVDPEKVPLSGVRARCSVCSGVFWVRHAGEVPATASGIAQAPAAAAPAPVAPLPSMPRESPRVAIAPKPSPERVSPPSVSAPGGPAPPRPVGPPPVFAPVAGGAHAAPPAARPQGGARLGPAVPAVPAIASMRGAVALPAAPVIREAPPPPATVPVPAATAPPRAAGPPLAPPPEPVSGAPAPAESPARKRHLNPFLRQDPEARARRLARALISDIVVYHPAKRREGLDGGDLKALFEEEIRKSWEEYVDQVGASVAESTPHFHEALNDILADGQILFP